MQKLAETLLEVNSLVKHFPIKKGFLSRVTGNVLAVDGVSFKVKKGATLGLVGESGCGKTTVGKTILKILEPTAGQIRFEKQDITTYSRTRMKPLRREMQIIFQDPFSSLNPRHTVGDIISAPLLVHKIANAKARQELVANILEKVGLTPHAMHRYPHEFSGGQRQRIGIARSLVLNPKLIIGDEPVSALDVSIQAQVINLLQDLQEELKLTYIMISHDLGVIRHISNEIAVMYVGKIVEIAPNNDLYTRPLHPYTMALLSAVPVPDPETRVEKIILEGDVPSPIDPPAGCRFHPRCPRCMDKCKKEEPMLKEIDGIRQVACHLYLTG
jgi:oligopeptide/dipeptide ABC transporter ATP-binding protein